MKIYGPHCSHDECAWSACDLSGEVEHSCRDQATCPHCGPEAEAWTRIAAADLAWTVSAYGTADPHALRELNVPPNVVARAELLAARDVPAAETEAPGQ
ncbi:MAG TPA: hypothetical protein VGD43_23820 [Micromonospora sp.]